MCHKEGQYLSHALVVVVARIRTEARNDQLRVVQGRELLQLIVVDEARFL